MRLSRRVFNLAGFSKYSAPFLSCPHLPVLLPPNNPAWLRADRIWHLAQRRTAAASFRLLAHGTASTRRSAADSAKTSPPHPIARQGFVAHACLSPNFPPSRRPLRSSVSYALYFIPLIAGAFFIYNVANGDWPYNLTIKEGHLKNHTAQANEEMEALPGRPGNLTPEEEEKLRKFWEMFLQICGVFDEEGTEGDAPTTLGDQGKAGTTGSDKPKKKHLNPFKKRKDKKESKTADKDATDTPVKENDPEDKWGETKAYHETLAKHPPEEIRATIWAMVKHDNPDALLLRFLRARKWDLQRALVMMVSTMNWRASEMRLDSDIMVNGEAYASVQEQSSDESVKKQGEDFLAQMRLGKSYCYGIDKVGRPICVCRARLHKAGEQSEASLERYTVYLIETTRFLLSPPVDTGCIVFDLTGFSLANMDYTPVKFMIKCFEANYPESLGIVLVHKAPWVFQGIWRIIRGWLDPVVASKVNFTNNVKDLEEFIDIDKIPDEMDGTSGWTYKYIEPVEGENDKMNDTETRDKLTRERESLYEEFEAKTIEWIHEDDTAKRAVIKSERSTIAQKLKEQYWRLDPYIRSRTLYDRIGVIKPGGKLDHYPTWEAVAASSTPVAKVAVETSSDDLD